MSDAYDIASSEAYPVELPSGDTFHVITEKEKEFVERSVEKYLSDNAFVNISDLRDVDGVITKELLIHRWQNWVSRRMDYFDQPIDEEDLTKRVKDLSVEVRQLKKAIGLDKATRDKMQGDDSFPAWLEQAKKRAAQFGQLRKDQDQFATTAFQELSAFLTFHDNCNEREQREQGATQDDVIKRLRKLIKDFEKIDNDFLVNVQQHWEGD